MTVETVKATAKLKDKEGNVTEQEREVAVEYDFGDDLTEAAERFGEQAVFNQFVQAARIGLQGILRRHAADPEVTDDKLQEIADDWKPGEKRVQRKTPADKLRELMSGRSEEEIQEILQQAGLSEAA